jgi:hypothetical protein
LTVAATLLVAGWAAAAAGAEHFRVTRHDDPRPGRCAHEDCSVREAIRAANRHPGRDMVVLPDRNPRYELSRTAGRSDQARGDLDVTGPTIIRHGRGGRATLDARGVDRVLEIRPGARTKLARINLTGGDVDRPGPDAVPRAGLPSMSGAGGGVLAHGELRLVRTVVLGNRADTGGGIFSTAPLSLNHSRIRGNRAEVGGGIDAYVSRVLIVRSALVANRAASGGGGAMVNGNILRLGNSTVSRNVADGPGGAVYLLGAEGRITKSTLNANAAHRSGGGLFQSRSDLYVVNTTITGNRAGGTGGGVQSSEAGGQVMLNSVTVARNLANTSHRSALGGGLSAKGGSFGVVNSIVALNRAAAKPSECHGEFDSFGGNLLGTMAGCRGFVGSALIAPAPRLGRLADNGGPTQTLALEPGSPAIDRANQHREPTVDQRDRRRVGLPDIGAFELGR